jgi:hypothetical protein
MLSITTFTQPAKSPVMYISEVQLTVISIKNDNKNTEGDRPAEAAEESLLTEIRELLAETQASFSREKPWKITMCSQAPSSIVVAKSVRMQAG